MTLEPQILFITIMLLLVDRLLSFGVNLDSVSDKISRSIPDDSNRTTHQKVIVWCNEYFLELAMALVLVFLISMAIPFFIFKDWIEKSIFSGIWGLFSFLISVTSTLCSRTGNKL